MDRFRHEPIVKNARWTVRCGCGFGRDVNTETRQQALDVARGDHPQHAGDWTVDVADYDAHPLFLNDRALTKGRERAREAMRSDGVR